MAGHLYVTSATHKLPGMPRNSPETPDSEKPKKIGISADLSREKLDRRVSVAPMMDWTEHLQVPLKIKVLSIHRMTCLLYVSSILQRTHADADCALRPTSPYVDSTAHARLLVYVDRRSRERRTAEVLQAVPGREAAQV
jgi:hypothetical protein